MLEITPTQDRGARHGEDGITTPLASEDLSPPCRYRREFAGFRVCRATSHVSVVTGKDCEKCPVPDTLERVDCFLLRANVTFVATPQVRWTCGATEDLVDPDDPDDCDACLGD
ncbi:MAG: hypothetical protein ACOCX2_12200 [Armatimonadota bacterium]